MISEYSTYCEKCGRYNLDVYCRECIFEEVKKIINECDPEPCCHGINKKELLKKIMEKK